MKDSARPLAIAFATLLWVSAAYAQTEFTPRGVYRANAVDGNPLLLASGMA